MHNKTICQGGQRLRKYYSTNIDRGSNNTSNCEGSIAVSPFCLPSPPACVSLFFFLFCFFSECLSLTAGSGKSQSSKQIPAPPFTGRASHRAWHKNLTALFPDNEPCWCIDIKTLGLCWYMQHIKMLNWRGVWGGDKSWITYRASALSNSHCGSCDEWLQAWTKRKIFAPWHRCCSLCSYSLSSSTMSKYPQVTEREHSFTWPSMGSINKQAPQFMKALHLPCKDTINFPLSVHSNKYQITKNNNQCATRKESAHETQSALFFCLINFHSGDKNKVSTVFWLTLHEHIFLRSHVAPFSFLFSSFSLFFFGGECRAQRGLGRDAQPASSGAQQQQQQHLFAKVAIKQKHI